jgi:EAL domain-containing protein (putative c-di-GMP-specific phosphodiesterase class I)
MISPMVSVSVNISGESLRAEDLVEVVRAALQESGLPPQQLVLEITENAFVDTSAAHRIAELKKLGVRLAIDDFGTGYSAINYLRRFPIDILKFDKSFVDNVVNEHESASLAKAIVGLASALRLNTVAEGIEEYDQAGSLSEFGVMLGQGYLFARRCPARTYAPNSVGCPQAPPRTIAGSKFLSVSFSGESTRLFPEVPLRNKPARPLVWCRDRLTALHRMHVARWTALSRGRGWSGGSGEG